LGFSLRFFSAPFVPFLPFLFSSKNQLRILWSLTESQREHNLKIVKIKFFWILILLVVLGGVIGIFWNKKSKEGIGSLPSSSSSATPIAKPLDGFGKLVKQKTPPITEEKKELSLTGVITSVGEESFVLTMGAEEQPLFISSSTTFYKSIETSCNREVNPHCQRLISQATREEVLKGGARVIVAYQNNEQGLLAIRVNLLS
jgi:hypothetical protein